MAQGSGKPCSHLQIGYGQVSKIGKGIKENWVMSADIPSKIVQTCPYDYDSQGLK
jgi:hypothetical protein